MNSNILVTGGNGQLGNELKLLLPEAIFTDADVLDITDETAVNNFVKNNNIEVIINCAAYTAVDKAEDNRVCAYHVHNHTYGIGRLLGVFSCLFVGF